MRPHARVVIIGSGIAGASIAWHLSELGWRDVVVLDRGPETGGTTSHAPGLVGQLRPSVSLTRMLMHSVALYRTLARKGQPGFFEVGSLRLASSPERMQELKRQAGFARAVGLEVELAGREDARRRFPLMIPDGVEGALWLPSDGSARAPILAGALLDAAKARGVEVSPETAVTGIEAPGGRVRAVLTARGRIATEIVVAACGIWSPRVGALAGVTIPLLPMQHQYLLTGPIEGLSESAPLCNLRDPDKLVYLRQDGRGLVVGGYERDPAPFAPEDIPESANPTVREFDERRFASLLAAAGERVPAVLGAGAVKRVNGLESFTPDGEFILGESPEVRGFWVACGFNAHGVSGAGGVGKVMAEWLVHGEPELDLWHMDLRRFGGYAASRRYVSGRVHEIYRTYYDLAFPGQERISARPLRVSPLYQRLRELGAVFGEKSGWERANWFTSNESAAARPRGWAGKHWSSAIAAEHTAARERVALFDETSFSKIEVEGPGALAFLQRVAANQMDHPPGTVTYSQLLNPRGGIESDLTITRLADDRFWLVTGTAFGRHDLDWLRRHLPADGVRTQDVTSGYACVGVWGPRARDLMARASADDFSNAAFPYLTARQVTVGTAPVLAVRVTYVGELGWEVYTPTEYGLALWDALWEAGRLLGAVPAGYRAIDSLRLEKGYRYWSADIDASTNPYEAGLGFAVKLDKGEFIGREALAAVKRQGPARRLRCILTDDPDAVSLGGEPVWWNGTVAGRVTSAGMGYTLGRSIAYSYLPAGAATEGTRVAIEMFGDRVPAAVAREPLYDPRGDRVRS